MAGKTVNKITWNLARNDFKKRFAGSYLGIIWAFVQPVITVLIYWFVFEKALNQGTQATKGGIEAPYVLWLLAGIVPWFYFSEAINSGATVFLDYSYLVKKVVFDIETLPMVKIISSLFVHVFFVSFTIVLYIISGLFSGIYTIQVIYYSAAMMVLCLGVTYLTSALTVFFRDLTQIVNIGLQVLIWATPIMWNIDAPGLSDMSPVLRTLLMLNPLYYIVSGYRGALLGKVWFWETPWLTAYYWILTIVLFLLGKHVFKKLRPHFADVL